MVMMIAQDEKFHLGPTRSYESIKDCMLTAWLDHHTIITIIIIFFRGCMLATWLIHFHNHHYHHHHYWQSLATRVVIPILPGMTMSLFQTQKCSPSLLVGNEIVQIDKMSYNHTNSIQIPRNIIQLVHHGISEYLKCSAHPFSLFRQYRIFLVHKRQSLTPALSSLFHNRNLPNGQLCWAWPAYSIHRVLHGFVQVIVKLAQGSFSMEWNNLAVTWKIMRSSLSLIKRGRRKKAPNDTLISNHHHHHHRHHQYQHNFKIRSKDHESPPLRKPLSWSLCKVSRFDF